MKLKPEFKINNYGYEKGNYYFSIFSVIVRIFI